LQFTFYVGLLATHFAQYVHYIVEELTFMQWLNSAGTGRNAFPTPVLVVTSPPTGVPAHQKCVPKP